MAMTETIVISNAITLLGHAPITTLSNPDQLTNAAIQAYNMLLPGILSQNNWRFAINIQPLVRSLEIAPSPWGAVYNLPTGFLKLIRLYPNIYEFDIYNNSKLYTILQNGWNGCGQPPTPPTPPPDPCCNRQQQFSIEYVFQPDVSQLPFRFVNYFIYEIALNLCLSSAQRPDYYTVLEKQRNYQYAMAAASEAQNRPQYSQVLFPVLTNRAIGGFIGNSSGAG